jgi:hypothetical protein
MVKTHKDSSFSSESVNRFAPIYHNTVVSDWYEFKAEASQADVDRLFNLNRADLDKNPTSQWSDTTAPRRAAEALKRVNRFMSGKVVFYYHEYKLG